MKSSSQKLQSQQGTHSLLQELKDLKTKAGVTERELEKLKFFLHNTELIANIGYWSLNLNTNLFTASEGAKRIYGVTTSTITLDQIKRCRLSEYNQMMDKALQDLITGKKNYDVTFKIKRKSDGSILTLNSKAEFNSTENHIFGIIRDITDEIRQMEQLSLMEQKWKGVIDSTPVPMAINDKNLNITYLNKAFTKLFGYTINDIPTVSIWFKTAYPDLKYQTETEKKWEESFEKFKKTRISIPPTEFEVTCKNGEKKNVLINNAALGEPIENNQLIILYDISDRKNAKEKQVEYLQVLEGVLNSINVRVFWKDKHLKYLGCNQNFAKDAGFHSVSEVIGKDDFEMGWKAQAELYQNDDLVVIDKKVPKLNIEEPQTSPIGKTITLLTNKIPMLNSSGEISGVIGTYLDITERKEQEMAMIKSQMYLQAVLQSTNDGIIAIGMNGEVLYANDKFYNITKIPKSNFQEKVNVDILDIISEVLEDDMAFRSRVKSIYVTKEASVEIIKFKDSRIIEHNAHLLILNDVSIGQVWSIRDITERMMAEAKVRQKDMEFQKLSLNVSDLIFQFTRRPDGSYFVPIASQGIQNIFGCKPEDVADNFEPIAKVLHPDDAERVVAEIEKSAKNLSFFTCEFRVQIPGKEVQWIYSRSNPEKLADGSITWYGFNTDITAKVKSEEKLLQLSEAVEQSPATIVITDTHGNIEYANPTFSKTTGYSKAEAIGKNPRILKSGETTSDEYKKLWETISSGKKWIGEFHNKDKYGKLYWESATIAPVIDKKGVIKNYLAIKMDITENKKAQLALEESNKRFILISKATHDAIWDLDLKTGNLIQSHNDAIENEIKLVSQTEKDWINLIHPEDLFAFTQTQQNALQNSQTNSWEHEYRMLNKNGQFSYVNSKGYIVRDAKGKAIRMIGASQDITERMTHLKAIEAQNKQLQEIAWIQSHIVRAPLARIMGLINLLNIHEEIPEELKVLMTNILVSAKEFDEIIRSISDKSRTFDRIQ